MSSDKFDAVYNDLCELRNATLGDPACSAITHSQLSDVLEVLHELSTALPPGPPPLTLVQKMTAIMLEMKRVPKRGFIEQGNGSFEVATAADIYDVARGEMAVQGVLLIGRPVDYLFTATDLVITFDFEWTDGKDRIPIPNVKIRVLEQADFSDKAVQKAWTIAHKMIVQNQFLISTGDADQEPMKPQKDPDGSTDPISTYQGALTKIEDGPADGDDRPFLWVFMGQRKFTVNDKLLIEDFKRLALPQKNLRVKCFQKPGSRHPRIIGILATEEKK